VVQAARRLAPQQKIFVDEAQRIPRRTEYYPNSCGSFLCRGRLKTTKLRIEIETDIIS
jgi:hypothetical protein